MKLTFTLIDGERFVHDGIELCYRYTCQILNLPPTTKSFVLEIGFKQKPGFIKVMFGTYMVNYLPGVTIGDETHQLLMQTGYAIRKLFNKTDGNFTFYIKVCPKFKRGEVVTAIDSKSGDMSCTRNERLRYVVLSYKDDTLQLCEQFKSMVSGKWVTSSIGIIEPNLSNYTFELDDRYKSRVKINRL